MSLTVMPSALPEPELDGSGLSIGIVVSRYHPAITGALLDEARQELQRLHVAHENIHVVYVPGTFELALAAQALLRGGSYDALICLGCVMHGETRHDVVVSDAAAQGIGRVALEQHVPVIFGVMCAQNQDQAQARIYRGRECARAAIEMARTIKALSNRQHKGGR
jgi:6,7-dimethyl-8-ribityllumazine synthase